MPYSLEQLKVFAEVAQTGSFTAAAQKLGKTQSTVSFAVANLEVDLDVQLFDRSSRQVQLTEAGARLLLEAREVLARCNALDALAQSIGTGVEAEFELISEVPLDCLMPCLLEFAQKFPHVRLHCHHPQHDVPQAVLAEGPARLGVMFRRGTLAPELEFVQLGRLVLTHVVSATHPLAQLSEVDYTDLHHYRRLSFRRFGEPLPSEAYLESNLCWLADSDTSLLHMVCAGLGWATLPRRMVLGYLQGGELVELRLRNYPHTDWLLSVELVWDRRRAPGPAGAWLRERIATVAIQEADGVFS
jgi:DNA-binding transcriptional LysR family regulator